MTDEFKFDTSQITTLDERFGKCPYATAQSLISGKWAPPILLYLSDGPIRFNELQRRMPKMTHATLSVRSHILRYSLSAIAFSRSFCLLASIFNSL